MIYNLEQIRDGFKVKVDVAVVGSGAAGAVLGCELQRSGLKTAILEEGGYFTTKDFKSRTMPMIKKLYRNGGMQMAIGKPSFMVPSGKCVGGSTVVNTGTIFRTPEQVFDRWQREFGVDFSYEDFLPHYEAVEKAISVHKSDPLVAGRTNTIFKEGVDKLGWQGDFLYRNAEGCIGCNMCNFGCPVDAKKSMLLTYIPEADRLGAKIYANSRAEKLMLKGKRAAGVSGYVVDEHGKETAEFTVECEKVVLSGGAVMSPIFLFKNHICNGSGQAGKNFVVQPVSEAVGFFDEDIKGWKGIPQAYYVTEFEPKGIVIEVAFPPPEVFTMKLPGLGDEHKSLAARYRNSTAAHAMIGGNGNGRVMATEDWHPRLFYSIDPQETGLLYEGQKYICEILFAAGANLVLPVVVGANPLKSRKDLVSFYSKPHSVSELLPLCYHPMGTCRMGDSPGRAVVKSNGETFEIENFYICDGSVFPTALGVNPQLTIMTLGRYTAHRMLSS